MFSLTSTSPRKFTTLPKEIQHKKLAEGIRQIYTARIAQTLNPDWLRWYGELCLLTALPPLEDDSPEALADRYHLHLKLAMRQLKEHNLLPHVDQGDSENAASPLPIHIYLDNIRSAHNIGSIFRTTEAFRLGSIMLSRGMAEPTHKQVRDAAMGTADWVPWEIVDGLSTLKRPIIALETSKAAHSIYSYPFPKAFTLAVGNEEYGCSPMLLAAADAIIQIPLSGKKNSLNVANAFAIAAAEINRQHRHIY